MRARTCQQALWGNPLIQHRLQTCTAGNQSYFGQWPARFGRILHYESSILIGYASYATMKFTNFRRGWHQGPAPLACLYDRLENSRNEDHFRSKLQLQPKGSKCQLKSPRTVCQSDSTRTNPVEGFAPGIVAQFFNT